LASSEEIGAGYGEAGPIRSAVASETTVKLATLQDRYGKHFI
jgi:hypothetical protein